LALAVGDYLSPEIQSGEITLPRRRIDYFLRAQLSAFAGWNRDMSMDVLKEQVAGEAAAEAALAEELEAGGK
jgi:hypothetical protein